jgi:hypothetical protein
MQIIILSLPLSKKAGYIFVHFRAFLACASYLKAILNSNLYAPNSFDLSNRQYRALAEYISVNRQFF